MTVVPISAFEAVGPENCLVLYLELFIWVTVVGRNSLKEFITILVTIQFTPHRARKFSNEELKFVVLECSM